MDAFKTKLHALIRQPWLKKSLKIVFPIAVIVFVFFHGKKELSQFSISDSLHAIRLLSSERFTALIILGMLAVATMYGYDWLLIRSIGKKFRAAKIFRTSWIANTFNGIFGFGGVVGVGVRSILYRETDKDTPKLLIALAWMAPSMISGLSLLSIAVLVGILPVHEVLAGRSWMWIVLVVVACLFPAYLISSRWKGKHHANMGLTFGYTLVSFLEWVAAGTVVYVILISLQAPVSYMDVLAVYVISAVAGIVSMVPGGFGAFDIMYLVGMQSIGVEDHLVFTGLLLFRIVYYFIPFGLGLIFAAFEFGGVAVRRWEEHPRYGTYIETGSILWFIQRSFWMSLSSWSTTILLLMTSLFLLLYGVTVPVPGISFVYIPWAHGPVFPILNGIIVGCSFVNLMMLKGVFERTHRAYYTLFVSLALCTVATFLLGTSLRHTLWLVGMVWFLYLLRKQFTRLRYPVSLVGTTMMTVCIVLFGWLYILLGNELSLLHDSIQFGAFLQSRQEWFSTLGCAAIVFMAMYVSGWFMLEYRQEETFGRPWRSSDHELFRHVSHGWLYLSLSNRRVYESDVQGASFPLIIKGRRIYILGQPQIDVKLRAAALTDLYASADLYGYRLVFLHVDTDWMPLLLDYGNDFFRIGERAKLQMTGIIEEPVSDTNIIERYDFPLDQSVKNHLLNSLSQWHHVDAHDRYNMELALEAPFSDYRLFISKPRSEQVWNGAAIVRIEQERKTLVIEDLRTTCLTDPFEPIKSTAVEQHLLHTLYQWAHHRGCEQIESGYIPLSHLETSIAPMSWSERTAIAMYRRIRHVYVLANQRHRFEPWSELEWESQYIAYPKQMSLITLMWKLSNWIRRSYRREQRRGKAEAAKVNWKLDQEPTS
ncbi:flippase-like domain-containing protein [Paenibacillus sp. 1001270B_150601_E10]|uniref:flippase-like domain-containing protein n=1 Tax=Paenibacillus sp. 1001270B_150601_E10 TaxID=2787079 RepID=UPI00189CBBF0|nr:flippase-like domain-containing protein [Paenibacillus sp. 1001270B_150601_E10]